MLDAWGEQVPHGWVTGDDEFGRHTQFRHALRERGERYVHRIDTMLVRWFPQRAAVGKLLFHTLAIDHYGGESP
jgi:SRSO17 transposase